jgi:hypothetical protein
MGAVAAIVVLVALLVLTLHAAKRRRMSTSRHVAVFADGFAMNPMFATAAGNEAVDTNAADMAILPSVYRDQEDCMQMCGDGYLDVNGKMAEESASGLTRLVFSEEDLASLCLCPSVTSGDTQSVDDDNIFFLLPGNAINGQLPDMEVDSLFGTGACDGYATAAMASVMRLSGSPQGSEDSVCNTAGSNGSGGAQRSSPPTSDSSASHYGDGCPNGNVWLGPHGTLAASLAAQGLALPQIMTQLPPEKPPTMLPGRISAGKVSPTSSNRSLGRLGLATASASGSGSQTSVGSDSSSTGSSSTAGTESSLFAALHTQQAWRGSGVAAWASAPPSMQSKFSSPVVSADTLAIHTAVRTCNMAKLSCVVLFCSVSLSFTSSANSRIVFFLSLFSQHEQAAPRGQSGCVRT